VQQSRQRPVGLWASPPGRTGLSVR
jgi:hypothetical protein